MPSAVRRHRHVAAWIACLAILLNALAPAIAHAIGAQRGEQALLGAVCTTDRSGLARAVLAAAAADDEGDGGSAQGMNASCPYCGTHAGAFLPPAASVVRLPVDGLRHAPPSLFLDAPRPLFAWAAVRARGPPHSA